MRKTPKKLSLNRITMRTLAGTDLELPAGGANTARYFISCGGTCAGANSCVGTCAQSCNVIVCLGGTLLC